MKKLKGPRDFRDTELSPDCFAFVLVEMHAGEGTPVSVRGNIGDRRLCVRALEVALDAIKSSPELYDDKQLVIPGKDAPVEQHPKFPTLERGDMT